MYCTSRLEVEQVLIYLYWIVEQARFSVFLFFFPSKNSDFSPVVMKGFNFLCSKCIRTHFERIFIKVELVLIRNSVKGTFLELFGVIKNILGINLNEIEKLTLLMYLLLDTILHMFAECMPHETFYPFQCFAFFVESVFFRSFVQIESTLFNLSR